ncbi:hypothetical protein DPMN_153964 [Dreissena polymorpha]|uniref:Sacsin/Nov domain-containing protein n=1 Tax=Dreissena polymorpha TaxID=45954 RepID=A0A9D4J5A2_DREPO|nr:hypothetical protein DPMN_153964 [Dreissena polymorpha]
MASSSGRPRKRRPEFSGMEQPPLIKQLRGILSKYPDGGQILKELIQNADDAGASELKIMLESRRINRNLTDESAEFTKFFQMTPIDFEVTRSKFKVTDHDTS